MGYRLQLTEARWPKEARLGDRLNVRSVWRNAGVAPCLPGGHPIWTLKDSQGGIVGVFVDDSLDARTLPVAPPGKAEPRTQERDFALPFRLVPGRYEVFVSIGTMTGTPKIALPLAGDDGQRRYRQGSVQIVGD